MAYLQAEIKRGFLRSLARAAKLKGLSLSSALEAYQDQRFSAIQSGQIMVSAAGAGYTTSFDVPPIGRQFTVDQIFALSEELLTIYGDCVTNQTAADLPTDDDSLLAAMLADDRLQKVTSTLTDFTVLRWPARY